MSCIAKPKENFWNVLHLSRVARKKGNPNFPSNQFPANTQRRRNIVTMSLQRQDVAATLLRRCVFAGLIYFPIGPIMVALKSEHRLNRCQGSVGWGGEHMHLRKLYCRICRNLIKPIFVLSCVFGFQMLLLKFCISISMLGPLAMSHSSSLVEVSPAPLTVPSNFLLYS